MYINTFQASPAPERYQISTLYRNTYPARRSIYTSPAPEKPRKYLKTPFRRRRSVCTHFSGAGEVLIYAHLAPEKPKKPETPEKHLYVKRYTLELYNDYSYLALYK